MHICFTLAIAFTSFVFFNNFLIVLLNNFIKTVNLNPLLIYNNNNALLGQWRPAGL